MTLLRVDNDLLIEQPSFNASPVAPVLLFLSLPAKSTRFILLYLRVALSAYYSLMFNSIKITVCALLLLAFINVHPIVLLVFPSSIL
jgi:hypothetical protein